MTFLPIDASVMGGRVFAPAHHSSAKKLRLPPIRDSEGLFDFRRSSLLFSGRGACLAGLGGGLSSRPWPDVRPPPCLPRRLRTFHLGGNPVQSVCLEGQGLPRQTLSIGPGGGFSAFSFLPMTFRHGWKSFRSFLGSVPGDSRANPVPGRHWWGSPVQLAGPVAGFTGTPGQSGRVGVAWLGGVGHPHPAGWGRPGVLTTS